MEEQSYQDMYDEMKRGWKSGLRDGTECGVGSTMRQTEEIRAHLPRIIHTYGIKSINDAGCGDLNWIKTMDLGDVKYKGYDLVPRHDEVIEMDITAGTMPECDLIICRDVFLHLSNTRIKKTIENFKKSGEYALMSSYLPDVPKEHPNRKDLLAEPFNFPEPLTTILEPHSQRFLGLWKLKDL